MSVTPSTACFRISSDIAKASSKVVSLSAIARRRSLGIITIASTSFSSSLFPPSAKRLRCAPSKLKRSSHNSNLVSPCSFEASRNYWSGTCACSASHTTSNENKISAFDHILNFCLCFFCCFLPTSGFIPAPRPLVRFF